eukprot:359740-Chlamydomonas_euryale.AAC.5
MEIKLMDEDTFKDDHIGDATVSLAKGVCARREEDWTEGGNWTEGCLVEGGTGQKGAWLKGRQDAGLAGAVVYSP